VVGLATKVGDNVGDNVGVFVGEAVTATVVGAINENVLEIKTVDCPLAHPPKTDTVPEPELGIINVPAVLANLVDEQLPPENVAPDVCKRYSPEVDDIVTVNVSP